MQIVSQQLTHAVVRLVVRLVVRTLLVAPLICVHRLGVLSAVEVRVGEVPHVRQHGMHSAVRVATGLRLAPRTASRLRAGVVISRLIK